MSTRHEGALPLTTSLLRVEPENVLVTVCKKAEDANALIVRAYESAGRPCTARIEMPLLDVSWGSPLGGCEIKTWRVTLDKPPEVTEVDLLERAIEQPC